MSLAQPARRRRRSKAPLSAFASRSPLHAFAVWLFRSAVIVLMGFAIWLLIANWAVPTLVDGFRP